ncbi:MAG: c-type cytochrome [Anaerolinea sp.]|nr:c-type cytochrome [Anaerolinea sp.]
MRRLQRVYLFTLLVIALVSAACSGERNERLGETERRVPGGDPIVGQSLAAYWGCGSCHRIPGVSGANSLTGPPLDGFERRQYIAGALINNTENLIAWIVNPQAIEPGTAMPNLGMSEEEARHIAAYLYTLTR